MKNSYYIVNPTNISEVQSLVPESDMPHDKLSVRLSLDGSKALIQCLVSEELEEYLTQIDALHIGDHIDGRAEQSVINYINNNRQEWEAAGE